MIPRYSSARAVLVDRCANVAQAIGHFEIALGVTVPPNASELKGAAMAELIGVAMQTDPSLTFMVALKRVVANNAWASQDCWYDWPGHLAISAKYKG